MIMLENFRKGVGIKMMQAGIYLCPGEFRNIVNERAQGLAMETTMQYLAKHGIIHCYKCPERFGLRKINDEYVCPDHVSLIPFSPEKETTKK